MSEYLIKGETITNIADAIREKANISLSLFPDDMPSYIHSIQTVSSDIDGIPADIVAEAERVATNIIPKIGSNSINFIAMSDMHEMCDTDHSDTSIIERYRRANLNAGQGAKLISDKINLDFYANLGDFAWGNDSTPIDTGIAAIVSARDYIYDIISSTKSFLTPGNHDALIYSSTANNGCVSYDVLKGLIGSYNYYDFESKKLRVICLNTADNNGSTASRERISPEQLQWFANSLDLSSKTDGSEWKIIILGHHPLDWGNVKVAANCLAAYLEGTTYNVTHESVSVSYNFSGKNIAKVIAQFHGHVHGFRVDYINDLRSGSPVATTVKRVAIPNACFGRNNEYGTNSGEDSNGIEFGETSVYNKVDNSTGKNTAFCVITVDLDEEIIYADCFGAGYDRIINYAVEEIITYSIQNNLDNATTNNSTSSVVSGSAYTASITANYGYSIKSITVNMGGTNITDSVVSGANIAIPRVTGDVIITVSTVAVTTYTITYDLAKIVSSNMSLGVSKGSSYSSNLTADSGYSINFARVLMGGTDITSTVYNNGSINISNVSGDVEIIAGYYDNLVPISLDYDLNGIFNNTGYKDGYYSSTDSPYYKSDTVGSTVTGLISYDIFGDNNGYFQPSAIYIKGVTFDTVQSHNRIGFYRTSSNSIYSTQTVANLSKYFTIETLGDNYYKLTPIMNDSGRNVLAETYSLQDITHIAISANGLGAKMIVTLDQPIASSISNLYAIAQEQNSTAAYNGVGYKNGTYLSTGSTSFDGTDANTVATGFIPYSIPDTGVPKTICVSGASWDESENHCRLYIFSTKTKYLHPITEGGGASSNALSYCWDIVNTGTNSFKLVPKSDSNGNWTALSIYESTNSMWAGLGEYLRLSLVGTGEDLIVTFEDVEIAPTVYTITNNLTNVVSNNSNSNISEGSPYNATLIPDDGYIIGSVTITMDGTDITGIAYNDDGTINIPSVSGSIVITAIAEVITSGSTYTNLVGTATATHNGTEIYNGVGYKDGAYVSSGTTPFGTDANTVAVGFIKFTGSDTIYIKCPNADITNNSHVRFYTTNVDSGNSVYLTANLETISSTEYDWCAGNGTVIVTVYKLADKYYKLVPNTDALGSNAELHYRISLYGKGEGLIITHNEPIE